MSHYDAWKTADVAGEELDRKDAALDEQVTEIISWHRHIELLKDDENLLDLLSAAFVENDYSGFHQAFDAAIIAQAQEEIDNGD